MDKYMKLCTAVNMIMFLLLTAILLYMLYKLNDNLVFKVISFPIVLLISGYIEQWIVSAPINIVIGKLLKMKGADNNGDKALHSDKD